MKGLLSSHFSEIAISIYDSDVYQYDDVAISSLSWLLEKKERINIVIEMYFKHLANKDAINGTN
jgi:hypothetical protein